ncbi:MAG: GNAT family N-acetyltransferase [Burkholderiales bacterium]|nr:GNAT family N-acetyltransferase [Burkholderiales bacterium]
MPTPLTAFTAPTIRLLSAHEWALYRAARLRALTDSPDAFGSTLASEQERTDDAWSTRLALACTSGKDHPLIAMQGEHVAGLVWGKVDSENADCVNVFQMWVAPESRGYGVGKQLLQAVIDWARGRQARCLQLGVTCGDTPAMRLYLRAGFKPVGATEALREGSALLSQTMQLRLTDER